MGRTGDDGRKVRGWKGTLVSRREGGTHAGREDSERAMIEGKKASHAPLKGESSRNLALRKKKDKK